MAKDMQGFTACRISIRGCAAASSQQGAAQDNQTGKVLARKLKLPLHMQPSHPRNKRCSSPGTIWPRNRRLPGSSTSTSTLR